jgi:predicted DNA-binding protein YlxM (UPF0122 family)
MNRVAKDGRKLHLQSSLLVDKKTRINILFDFYGSLLTEKQQEFITYYFNEDFSLAEIAENHQISRQAVNDHLKRAELLLEDYESKLLLMAKHVARAKLIQLISEACTHTPDARSMQILEFIEQLKAID